MRKLARLVLLGASVAACGSSISAQAPTPVGPSDLEVLSHKWVLLVTRTNPPAPVPNSQSVERSDTHPLEPIDPTPKVSGLPGKQQVYIYSAEVVNKGRKEIKAVSWEYLFTDPVTHAKLKRQTGVSVVKIRSNQTRTLQIRTPSSPPKVINAASINGGAFAEGVVFHCIRSGTDDRVLNAQVFRDGNF